MGSGGGLAEVLNRFPGLVATNSCDANPAHHRGRPAAHWFVVVEPSRDRAEWRDLAFLAWLADDPLANQLAWRPTSGPPDQLLPDWCLGFQIAGQAKTTADRLARAVAAYQERYCADLVAAAVE